MFCSLIFNCNLPLKRLALSLFALCIVFSCSFDTEPNQNYHRWVGDIEHDPAIDSSDFDICFREKDVRQYFHMNQGLVYEGEKRMISAFFEKNYQPVESKDSGWIRVRFIVNCEGKTGRFRMMEADGDYQKKAFDPRISRQILELTQSLDGWKALKYKNKPVDYYQYLVFKINKGKIEKIMP